VKPTIKGLQDKINEMIRNGALYKQAFEDTERPGTTWKRVGIALMAIGSFSAIPLLQLSSSPWWPIFGVALPAILLFAGAFLSWRGRQYAAQASVVSIITDAKPHLLYLRPFRSDYTTTKTVLIEVFLTEFATTEEEELADVLRPFGELVAIGRPGESLPTPGAARIYASDEEWKDVVKRQMQATRLVVIRAGVGENVLWELTQAVRTLEPQKLLILVREMKAKDYESFRTEAKPILGVSLPERAIPRRFGRVFGFRRVSGFISFAPDWKPSFLALKAPYFRGGSFKGLAKYALRPVFESFGLEWQPPPFSFGTQRGFLLMVGFFVAINLAALLLKLAGY
jgi:hypothetical protein